jgi:hypothetical protein
VAELDTAYDRAAELLHDLPEELLTKDGILPWCGAPYDHEDFFAYQYNGHKREHAAQIAVFRDPLN